MTLNFWRKKKEEKKGEQISYRNFASYEEAWAIRYAEELAPYFFNKKELAVIFGLRSLELGDFPASTPPRRLPEMAFSLIEEISLAGVPKPLRKKLMEDLDFLWRSGMFITRYLEEVGGQHILYIGNDRGTVEWREGTELSDQRFRLSSMPAPTIPIAEFLFWIYTSGDLENRLVDLSEWTNIPPQEQRSLLGGILLFMRKDYPRRLPDYEKELGKTNFQLQFPFVCHEDSAGVHCKRIF